MANYCNINVRIYVYYMCNSCIVHQLNSIENRLLVASDELNVICVVRIYSKLVSIVKPM